MQLKTREIEYLSKALDKTERKLGESQAAHRATLDKMVAIEDLFIDNLESFKKLELERKALALGLSKGEALTYADVNAPSAVETDLDVVCTLGTVKDMLSRAEQVASNNVSSVRQQLSRRENECQALQATQVDMEARVQALEGLLRAAEERGQALEEQHERHVRDMSAETARRTEAEDELQGTRQINQQLRTSNDAHRKVMTHLTRSVNTFVKQLKNEITRRHGYLSPALATLLDAGPQWDLLQMDPPGP
eukprot:g4733.t1